MVSPEDAVTDSPIHFEHAVAYALHPDMRRLIILHVVGVLLASAGMSWFLDPPVVPLIGVPVGLSVAILGAIFLFGGIVGALYKLVADATILARQHGREQ